jgi:hypothetical protein
MRGWAGTPARSSSVGAKSTFTTSASVAEPAGTRPGRRISSGIRRDSSYMNRLSNQPWSPRKKPWSEVYATTVSRPEASTASSSRPTLSSSDATQRR